MKHRMCRLGLFLSFFLSAACVQAEQAVAGYVGSEKCEACHKQQNRVYTNSMHGRIFTYNPRNRAEAMGCEACHGPGSNHIKVVGELDYTGPLYIKNFKHENGMDEVVTTCMECHQGGERMHWRSSEHALEGIGCTDCHKIHDPEKTNGMKACFGCHKTERAKLQRSIHMPIREGKITCMDCHNPHGGIGPSLLKTASVNETCYQCHQDKRGPNIFEHPPVQDSCVNCHDPHGSNYARLLKKKPPYLCQQCHVVQFHPSDLYDGADLRNAGIKQLRGKACLNCHSRIHGSNHPSGAFYQR